VAAKGCTDPLDDRALLGHRIERRVKGLRTLARDLPQEVCFRVDVRVERALLQAERFSQIADGGAVIPLLREKAGGGAG
jgi:hypothetical protein